MARLFDDAASQSASVTAGVVTGMPFSVGLLFNTDYDGDFQGLCCSWVGSMTTNAYFLILTTGNAVRIRAWDSGGQSQECDTTTTYSLNQWNHTLGIFAGAADRRIYLNGGGKNTNADSCSPSTPANFTVADWAGYDLSGKVAELFVWDVALNDAEAWLLGRIRISPWLIRPTRIIGAWPFWRGRMWDRDMSGRGNHLTPVNGPTWAPDPPWIQKRWLDMQIQQWEGQLSGPVVSGILGERGARRGVLRGVARGI